jgi:hypothetical protein
MDEHVEHRPLDGVGVHPLTHGEVALRIQVDDENALPRLPQRDAEVERRRRLRDAALLVRERDDVRHHGVLVSRDRRRPGSRNRMEARRRLLDLDCRRVDSRLDPRLGPRQDP